MPNKGVTAKIVFSKSLREENLPRNRRSPAVWRGLCIDFYCLYYTGRRKGPGGTLEGSKLSSMSIMDMICTGKTLVVISLGMADEAVSLFRDVEAKRLVVFLQVLSAGLQPAKGFRRRGLGLRPRL